MRTTCPYCGNPVPVHLTSAGVTMAPHHVSRTSGDLCRPDPANGAARNRPAAHGFSLIGLS